MVNVPFKSSPVQNMAICVRISFLEPSQNLFWLEFEFEDIYFTSYHSHFYLDAQKSPNPSEISIGRNFRKPHKNQKYIHSAIIEPSSQELSQPTEKPVKPNSVFVFSVLSSNGRVISHRLKNHSMKIDL